MSAEDDASRVAARPELMGLCLGPDLGSDYQKDVDRGRTWLDRTDATAMLQAGRLRCFKSNHGRQTSKLERLRS